MSPHLQVWRWHVTMAASILHRATGVALYGGAADPGRLGRRAGHRARRLRHATWACSARSLGKLVLFGLTVSLLLPPGRRHPAPGLGRRLRLRAQDRRHDRRPPPSPSRSSATAGGLGPRLDDGGALMASYRTPLARARGLGSAKHGVGHWLVRAARPRSPWSRWPLGGLFAAWCWPTARLRRRGRLAVEPGQRRAAGRCCWRSASCTCTRACGWSSRTTSTRRCNKVGAPAAQPVRLRAWPRALAIFSDPQGRLRSAERSDGGLRVHRPQVRRGRGRRRRLGPARGAGLRPGRAEDRLRHQGLPDPLAHRGGPGRHLRRARQHGRRTTGAGTCTTPSRGRTGWATRTPSNTCAATRRPRSTSWSTGACPSRAPTRARSTSAPSAA